jgi:hypothetical protein
MTTLPVELLPVPSIGEQDQFLDSAITGHGHRNVSIGVYRLAEATSARASGVNGDLQADRSDEVAGGPVAAVGIFPA